MVFDATKPAASDYLSDSQADIAENFRAIKEDGIFDPDIITTQMLTSKPSGKILNQDPNTSDITAWIGDVNRVSLDATIETITDGWIGNTAIQIGAHRIIASNRFPINRSLTYIIKTAFRTTDSGSNLLLHLVQYADDGSTLSNDVIQTLPMATFWQQSTSTIITPETTAVTAQLYFSEAVATTNTFQLQNIRIEEYQGDAATLEGSTLAQVISDAQTSVNATQLESHTLAQVIGTHGHEIFSTDGTFTVPYGVTKIYITACAGGGGGGGGDPADPVRLGSGGRIGESIYRQEVTTVAEREYAIVIGSGGTGGANGTGAGGVNGTAGGNTTIIGTDLSIILDGGALGVAATDTFGAYPDFGVLGQDSIFSPMEIQNPVVKGASGHGGFKIGYGDGSFTIMNGQDGGNGCVLIEW
jgi:hypothetical protein